ncbi:MAG TPA: CopD family protein [Chitinophagaceae bacterium]
MYLYIKAIHIIFIVTWFAGLFYMPRLFIYNAEAESKSPEIRGALHEQFLVMMKRLWYGITWPSAILTLIFGLTIWHLLGATPGWLLIKLAFVVGLYAYHFSLHIIFRQQIRGVFKYSSQQLRIWNEVATVFLLAIVMLVVVKQNMSVVWGLTGLVLFIILLMSAIRVYKMIRNKGK